MRQPERNIVCDGVIVREDYHIYIYICRFYCVAWMVDSFCLIGATERGVFDVGNSTKSQNIEYVCAFFLCLPNCPCCFCVFVRCAGGPLIVRVHNVTVHTILWANMLTAIWRRKRVYKNKANGSSGRRKKNIRRSLSVAVAFSCCCCCSIRYVILCSMQCREYFEVFHFWCDMARTSAQQKTKKVGENHDIRIHQKLYTKIHSKHWHNRVTLSKLNDGLEGSSEFCGWINAWYGGG